MVEDTVLKDQVKKRFNQLKDKRAKYEPDIIDACQFCMPRRSDWDVDSDAAPPIPKTFNSHANWALKICAQGLESCMVSRSKPWFSVEATCADNTEIDDINMAADWLEDVTKRLHRKLATSTFYSGNSESIPDACCGGTGYMYSEMDPVTKRMFFRAIHPREVFIAENNYGQVDTVYRRYNMTYRQVVQNFGDDCPESITEKAKTKPDDVCRMLHAVFPRDERDPDSVLAIDLPYASVFISLSDDALLHVGGFYELPWHVWRYTKNSDEVYGRGAAIDAMIDIKVSQQASKTRLELAQMVSNPPKMVPRAYKDDARLTPGGITYTTPDAGEIKPVVLGANYPINKDVINELNEAIDNHFNVKFFLMISTQEREMTAYEAAERRGEQAAILGAAIGRYETEFISSCIERTYSLMLRAGEIPPPPPGLAQHGASLNIRYCGYLAQLQARYFQSSGVTESIQLFNVMAQLAPQALDNYDLDEFTREATDGFGLNQKAKRELDEVKKIRAQRLQQQQAAQKQAEQQAIMGAAMQNADKLNQKVNPGTPLSAIAQGAGLNGGAVS